jgi:hypothetical protein
MISFALPLSLFHTITPSSRLLFLTHSLFAHSLSLCSLTLSLHQVDIHSNLTLAQMAELAKLKPDLLNNQIFAERYLDKLVPSADAQEQGDTHAHHRERCIHTHTHTGAHNTQP